VLEKVKEKIMKVAASEEDVPQLQDHPPQRRGARDLHRPPPQAAARLS
jgi:hypothetical protein